MRLFANNSCMQRLLLISFAYCKTRMNAIRKEISAHEYYCVENNRMIRAISKPKELYTAFCFIGKGIDTIPCGNV